MSWRKFKMYLNMPAWIHMLWCEFLVKFGFGAQVKIKYSLKCNSKCPYCTINMPDGDRAEFDEIDSDRWLDIIDRFPIKVRKIIWIGGEACIYEHTTQLVNEFIKRGIVVKVFSNLTRPTMTEIKSDPHFKLITTYHHSLSYKLVKKNYDIYRKLFRIKHYELSNVEKKFPKSHTWELLKEVCPESSFYRNDFIFAPNGNFHFNLGKLYELKGRQPVIDEYTPNIR